jgi:hypothetical protein
MSEDTSDEPEPFATIDIIGDNLDPDEIVPLITIRPIRANRKGDPMGPARGSAAPLARTGTCHVSTIRRVSSPLMDDHVRFLLDELEKSPDRLRDIVRARGLTWRITCIYDPPSEELVPDTVSQQSLDRAERYGIPIEGTLLSFTVAGGIPTDR